MERRKREEGNSTEGEDRVEEVLPAELVVLILNQAEPLTVHRCKLVCTALRRFFKSALRALLVI